MPPCFCLSTEMQCGWRKSCWEQWCTSLECYVKWNDWCSTWPYGRNSSLLTNALKILNKTNNQSILLGILLQYSHALCILCILEIFSNCWIGHSHACWTANNQTTSTVTFHDLLQTPPALAAPRLSIHVYQQGEQMSRKTKQNEQIIVNYLNLYGLAQLSLLQSQKS